MSPEPVYLAEPVFSMEPQAVCLERLGTGLLPLPVDLKSHRKLRSEQVLEKRPPPEMGLPLVHPLLVHASFYESDASAGFRLPGE